MKIVDDKTYYTVKEYSQLANISDKAVYQQLKTRLKEHSTIIDGVQMVSEDALFIFHRDNSSFQVKFNQVELNEETKSIDKYLTYLEQNIIELKEQIKGKDKMIQEMQQQIINLSNSIVKISNENLQQIASITKNIQLLQVAEAREDIIKNQENEIIEQPKRSFWDRMRGK